MPARLDNCFEQIAAFGALHQAAMRAVRGKRSAPGAAAFLTRLESELLRLERQLLDHSYRPGRYTEMVVRDPKMRQVSAAPFRDRVVHHALCAVVAPTFEHSFIHHSYANRVGKGTHRAVARFERLRDRHRHVLRCDIYRFFPAIDHDVLKADLRRRIACPRTLWLLDALIDGSNRQEPVALYFPGDDLFTPATRRRGLPIGNLTSQLFGNIYLDRLDHFATEVLHAPYLRYADDFALFADDPVQLQSWRERIAAFLEKRRLLLHPRKTFLASTTDSAEFLGFELLPGGRRRLSADGVTRFARRLRQLRCDWRSGAVDSQQVRARVSAWVAHARHADTVMLRHALFRGGWFDPLWQDERSEPLLRSGRY